MIVADVGFPLQHGKRINESGGLDVFVMMALDEERSYTIGMLHRMTVVVVVAMER